MKTPEAPQPKKIKEMMRIMKDFNCPRCDTPMEPSVGVATAASGYPTEGKPKLIDVNGKEIALIYAYLQCPLCDMILPVSSIDIQ